MLIKYHSTLLKKIKLAEEVYKFVFTRPEDDSWTYSAGQYMLFHIPDPNERVIRQYSIASSPSEKELEFIVEILPQGRASQFLVKMEEGEKLELQGPAGVFTFKSEKRPAIFLATGTGIAPIYSMLADLAARGKETGKLYLFWGMKTCEEAYYIEEFEYLKNNFKLMDYFYCMSRETDENVRRLRYRTNVLLGRVTKGLEHIEGNDHLESFDYYLCGGKEIVESLRQFLAGKVIPANQIYFEKFTL